MLIGALAALAAALCWTLASSLWRRLPTSLSGAELNLLKNWLALAMLLPLVLGRPWPAAHGPLLLLAVSLPWHGTCKKPSTLSCNWSSPMKKILAASASLMMLAGAFGGAIAGNILALVKFVGLNLASLVPVVIVVVTTAVISSRASKRV